MPSKNEGVMQSGGTMNVGAMAVGKHASAVQNRHSAPAGIEEVRSQMERLIELLSQQGQISNRDEVLQSAQTAKQELAKEKPNKLTLKALLGGIAESVKSVTTVATAVEALKLAVTALFG